MTIHDLVTIYVNFRKHLGEKCKTNENILRSFGRAVGPQTEIREISLQDVTTFLAGNGPITSSWHIKYSALKGFFEFAVSRGHRDEIPLPLIQPKRPPKLRPYIYSRDQIRHLLDTIPACGDFPKRMQPCTLRAILLTMYGAGLRRQEVLDLSLANVDLSQALLTIRNTKFDKSRFVPIGRNLAEVLREYDQWRKVRHPASDGNSPFFPAHDGSQLGWWTLHHAFDRLRKKAQVQRDDGGRYQPRLHDLRHTFAVHRLTEWYRQGADVQQLLYPLSVYLGHANLASTQVYLTMTPELLQQASLRFENYACGEEDHHV